MKNKTTKIILIIASILCILFGINLKSYAANTVEGNASNIFTETTTNTTNENKNTTNQVVVNNTNSEKVNSITKTTQTQKATTSKKSSNANLKNLGIKPYDFSGFRPEKTEYEVKVPEDTKSIEVYAQAQNSKAKVSGTGTKKLENEENTINIVVTAEDGTTKTYKINIIKSNVEENSGNNEENGKNNGKGLESLQINELKLNPDFDTNTYEYNVKYIGEDTKLEIKANPTDENYIVEIVGNNELKEGENIITILVSEKNGDNVATYQITVNKSLVDEEAIAREEAQKKEEKKRIILGSIVGIIMLAIIIFIIIKIRKNKNYDNEYSEVPFYGMNNDDDENDDLDIPKALSNENEDKEKLAKENAKSEFLEQYNFKDIDEKPKRRKSKGKRFK